MDKITGKIHKVRFYDSASGFTIASFLVDKNYLNYLYEKEIYDSKIIIQGIFLTKPNPGDYFLLEGSIIDTAKYGRQFKVETVSKNAFSDEESLIRFFYLTFDGVGIKTATKIVKNLGTDAIDKIRSDSSCLDKYITRSTKEKIIKKLNEQDKDEEIKLFLYNFFSSSNRVAKILIKAKDPKSYLENPYKLVLDGFVSFDEVDEIINSKNIPYKEEDRISAYVLNIVKKAFSLSGSTYLYLDELVFDEKIISKEIFYQTLNSLSSYVVEDDKLIDKHLKAQDEALATDLNLRNKMVGFSEKEIEVALSHLKLPALSLSQKEALQICFKKHLFIITGGPGTGKTYLTKTIIDLFKKLKPNGLVYGVAPTGKAAKRLGAQTGLDASTIHRYLEASVDADFGYNKNRKKASDLLIIDEASMLDSALLKALLDATPLNTHLIFLGDVNQLPPIGDGCPLFDMLNYSQVARVYLKEIFRQTKESKIIALASAIVDKKAIDEIIYSKSNIAYFNNESAELIFNIYQKSLAKGKTIKDLQILIPKYKGSLGIDEVNKGIQAIIQKENKYPFYPNDKIIQLENDLELGVMNGDIGYVKEVIYEDDTKLKSIVAVFDDKEVCYDQATCDEIALAYAISVHKSQGSEFDTVIMPASFSYYPLFKKRLIYTAITRAKAYLIIVGSLPAIKKGLAEEEILPKTLLKELLK